jgi:hypothetical protein
MTWHDQLPALSIVYYYTIVNFSIHLVTNYLSHPVHNITPFVPYHGILLMRQLACRACRWLLFLST